MSALEDILGEVRAQIEPRREPLHQARARLQLARDSAKSFPGSLRTYRSGSLAAHTMNRPVTDGDGGLVLDRRHFPKLGPEGGGEAPGEVVDALRDHLRPLLRKQFPDVVLSVSKRGPKIHFHQPADGCDPTVDLVVAMTRREGPGIWIPNLETGKWEPSDPEAHVRLFNEGAAGFLSTRRKVSRLAKAWNKQFSAPGASSFEICTWAYEFVQPGHGVATGLHALFGGAATRLAAGKPTHDPAGASADLKLVNRVSTTGMAARLHKAAGNMAKAIAATGDQQAREALGDVFWNYLDTPAAAALKNSVGLLRTGRSVAAAALGVGILAAATGAAYRAFGGAR